MNSPTALRLVGDGQQLLVLGEVAHARPPTLRSQSSTIFLSSGVEPGSKSDLAAGAPLPPAARGLVERVELRDGRVVRHEDGGPGPDLAVEDVASPSGLHRHASLSKK
jgi:hypothetical protein